jgi:hypothetical protein
MTARRRPFQKGLQLAPHLGQRPLPFTTDHPAVAATGGSSNSGGFSPPACVRTSCCFRSPRAATAETPIAALEIRSGWLEASTAGAARSPCRLQGNPTNSSQRVKAFSTSSQLLLHPHPCSCRLRASKRDRRVSLTFLGFSKTLEEYAHKANTL